MIHWREHESRLFETFYGSEEIFMEIDFYNGDLV